MIEAGAIDCDVHPTVPGLDALVPYMSDHWQDMVRTRGLDELVSISYPANSPITARADWRPAKGKPAGTLEQMRSECLDPFKTSIAICNCLYGAQLLFSEDMGSAFASAVNDWIAGEWLDREPRHSSAAPAESRVENAARRCLEKARVVGAA